MHKAASLEGQRASRVTPRLLHTQLVPSRQNISRVYLAFYLERTRTPTHSRETSDTAVPIAQELKQCKKPEGYVFVERARVQLAFLVQVSVRLFFALRREPL